MAAALPQSRELLTSLIDAITDIPLERPHVSTRDAAGDGASSSHPLKAVPPSHRHLLVTLHVLFPALLLPALDLLDRGLITRLVLERNLPPPGGVKRKDESQVPAETLTSLWPSSSPYLVRSAQQPLQSRRRHYAPAGGPSSGPGQAATYTVRLASWNCTCAAFAFAAFPGSSSRGEASGDYDAEVSLDPGGNGDGDNRSLDLLAGPENSETQTSGAWSFGGASLDGTRGPDGSDGVPCCKHLLACLLAERWHEALGSYVTERRVRPEEMAGIIADI